MLLSAAADCIDAAFEEHLRTYHVEGMNDAMLHGMGFFKNTPSLEIDRVKTQHFYDHTYCTYMDGFDYVKRWTVNESKT